MFRPDCVITGLKVYTRRSRYLITQSDNYDIQLTLLDTFYKPGDEAIGSSHAALS